MRVDIQNFRGVSRAIFDLIGIVLIGGDNRAGKTNIAAAVGAVLTGKAIDKHGAVKISWPSIDPENARQPPLASAFAAGVIAFEDLPAEKRTVMVIDVLLERPTKTDLESELAPHGISDKTISKLWQGIQLQGWDAVHELMEEHGKKKSETAPESVVRYQRMIDALGPGGIRKQKACQALGRFNELLEALVASTGEAPAKWGHIHIDENFQVRHEQRSGITPSASEKYQANVLLQVAFAKLDKSDAVIIDNASILMMHGRNGLMRLLRKAEIPALVMMSANSPTDIFDMPSDIGASYWLDKGVLVPLSDAVAQAKEAADETS